MSYFVPQSSPCLGAVHGDQVAQEAQPTRCSFFKEEKNIFLKKIPLYIIIVPQAWHCSILSSSLHPCCPQVREAKRNRLPHGNSGEHLVQGCQPCLFGAEDEATLEAKKTWSCCALTPTRPWEPTFARHILGTVLKLDWAKLHLLPWFVLATAPGLDPVGPAIPRLGARDNGGSGGYCHRDSAINWWPSWFLTFTYPLCNPGQCCCSLSLRPSVYHTQMHPQSQLVGCRHLHHCRGQ